MPFYHKTGMSATEKNGHRRDPFAHSIVVQSNVKQIALRVCEIIGLLYP